MKKLLFIIAGLVGVFMYAPAYASTTVSDPTASLTSFTEGTDGGYVLGPEDLYASSTISSFGFYVQASGIPSYSRTCWVGKIPYQPTSLSDPQISWFASSSCSVTDSITYRTASASFVVDTGYYYVFKMSGITGTRFYRGSEGTLHVLVAPNVVGYTGAYYVYTAPYTAQTVLPTASGTSNEFGSWWGRFTFYDTSTPVYVGFFYGPSGNTLLYQDWDYFTPDETSTDVIIPKDNRLARAVTSTWVYVAFISFVQPRIENGIGYATYFSDPTGFYVRASTSTYNSSTAQTVADDAFPTPVNLNIPTQECGVASANWWENAGWWFCSVTNNFIGTVNSLNDKVVGMVAGTGFFIRSNVFPINFISAIGDGLTKAQYGEDVMGTIDIKPGSGSRTIVLPLMGTSYTVFSSSTMNTMGGGFNARKFLTYAIELFLAFMVAMIAFMIFVKK